MNVLLTGAGGMLARAVREVVVVDQRGAPTWTTDLARTLAALLERGAPPGTYHATNSGDASWYELACVALAAADIEAGVQPVASATFPTRAARPAYSVLDCSATWAITGTAPHWRAALRTALCSGL